MSSQRTSSHNESSSFGNSHLPSSNATFGDALFRVPQPGLSWRVDTSGEQLPEWTVEPSLEAIEQLVRNHFDLHTEDSCLVSFLAEGLFNRVYAVDCRKGQYVMRVTLPVAPKIKTLSEIATVSLIRANTTIPTPRVLDFNADFHNDIGFEWMLMERVHGKPLRDTWGEMSWLKKGLLIQQIASFMAQLFRIQMPAIGSIYERSSIGQLGATGFGREFSLPLDEFQSSLSHIYFTGPSKRIAGTYVLREAVLSAFYYGDCIHQQLPRGPFTNSQDYVNAYLRFLSHDATRKLASKDKYDIEEGMDMQHVHDRLKRLVPNIFERQQAEPTVLHHHDLSRSNILVDEDGNLVSIIDWECVAAVPLWEACRLPEFLEGPSWPELPLDDDTPDEGTVYDYEVTHLRKFFFEEMQRVEPRWLEVFKKETLKADVLLAIKACYSEEFIGRIKRWLTAVEGGGEVGSLADLIRNGRW